MSGSPAPVKRLGAGRKKPANSLWRETLAEAWNNVGETHQNLDQLDEALERFGAIFERGHDLQVVLESLLGEIKDLSLFQALGRDNTYFQDHPPDSVAFYARHAERVPPDEAQQLFGLFLELESQLKWSQHARACFEMALVKACRISSICA